MVVFTHKLLFHNLSGNIDRHHVAFYVVRREVYLSFAFSAEANVAYIYVDFKWVGGDFLLRHIVNEKVFADV